MCSTNGWLYYCCHIPWRQNHTSTGNQDARPNDACTHHARTHARTHARMHAHTHTHTHTRTHTRTAFFTRAIFCSVLSSPAPAPAPGVDARMRERENLGMYADTIYPKSTADGRRGLVWPRHWCTTLMHGTIMVLYLYITRTSHLEAFWEQVSIRVSTNLNVPEKIGVRLSVNRWEEPQPPCILRR